jgi:hypothetical protein
MEARTAAMGILPIKVTVHGVSSSGIPPQGTGNSRKPIEGGDLKLVACKLGRLHLGNIIKLPGSTRRKFKS